MPDWPKDNFVSLRAYYGDPRGPNGTSNKQWEIANLTRIIPPFRMVAAWDLNARINKIAIHKKCAESLYRILDRIWDEYDNDQVAIERVGINRFGGTFNYRLKRGLASLSVHAFGAAIDLDPERNGMGAGKGTMPRAVIDAFKDEGAIWGGDFKSRSDPMHFQFATL